MLKNKLLLLLLIPITLNAVITIEQFKALADDKKWEFYCDHNAHYRHIFKVKDDAIIKLENNANFWQTVAIVSTCFAIGTGLLGVSTAYYAIMNPRAPRV